MSLPQKAFFNNHGSIAEDQEFVCQEVAKLLASGAVTEFTVLPFGLSVGPYLFTKIQRALVVVILYLDSVKSWCFKWFHCQ